MKWEYTEQELWRFGENGDSIFHVFSTVTVGSTVLVFAEARQGDGSDAGCTHDIRMCRSFDGGRTFPEDLCILPSEGHHCWTNATPVYDRETGRLFLFYSDNIRNAQTVNYLMYSDDAGTTWSAPQNITPLLEQVREPQLFHLAGPGHGIQLKNGSFAGRLLMQFWHRSGKLELPASERGYCASVLYSDDHGASWNMTEYLGHEQLVNESRLIETRSDILWMLRTKQPHQCESRSRDGGVTWEPMTACTLPEARNCDVGAVSLEGKEGYQDMVLISRVSNPNKRVDMEIRISRDGGRTYDTVFTLMPGDAMPGYSDLCVIEEEEPVIGLVHCRNNHVLFSRISLQTLTAGKYENTTRNCWLQ